MTSNKPLTIVGLEISGYKRIRAINLKPEPTGLVVLNGKNEQGKSTVVDAIGEGLIGGRHPGKPVHDGKKRADIKIDFGELDLWIRYTDPNDSSKYAIDIKNKLGGKIEGGQRAVMDALVSKLVDPTRFALMSAPEQTREVMSMIDLPIDLAANKLRESAAMQKRALCDKQVGELEGKVAELREAASEAPTERVDLASLTGQMQEAIDHNRIWDETGRRRKRHLEEYKTDSKAIEAGKRDIAELEERLANARVGLESLKAAAESTLKTGKAVKAELEALGPERNTASIQDDITQAQASAAAYSAADRLYDREVELEERQDERQVAHSEVEAARKEAKDALAAATFPVEGMSYDVESEGIFFDGDPLKQASQGRLVLIGAELGMKKEPKPRIRVLFCREGSFVDPENLVKLAQLADDEEWQVWLERTVGEPDGTGVWIEDGLAVGEIAQEVV